MALTTIDVLKRVNQKMTTKNTKHHEMVIHSWIGATIRTDGN